jgi:hypothetical protein
MSGIRFTAFRTVTHVPTSVWGQKDNSSIPAGHRHLSIAHLQDPVHQLPNDGCMANKDHLVKSAKVHSPAQHAHVLLAIGSIQSSHRFVPEQRFVTSAFALPHVVDGDAQVDGFVD